MSNGINPYIGAAAQQTIADSLIEAQRNIKTGRIEQAVGQQEFKKIYQDDLQKADEIQAEQLAKEKNKTLFGEIVDFVAPILTIFNPLAGTILGGIGGATDVYRTAEQQKENLDFARSMGLDTSKYMNTFIEEGALEDASIREDMLDAYEDSIVDDPLSIFKAGVNKALETRTIGQGVRGLYEGTASFLGQDAALKGTDDYVKFLPSVAKGLKDNVYLLGDDALGTSIKELLSKMTDKQKKALSKFIDL